MEIIPIINEEGEVIGKEECDLAHQKGLLHPGSRVIVKLPDGKIVFQRRSLTKETNPGKLAVAAGGHIQFGQTPEEAAASELLEETGIAADPNNFFFLGNKWILNGMIAGMPHRVLGYYYGYHYPGKIEDFKVEEGEGAGFESYTFAELAALTEKEKEKFCEQLLDDDMMAMFEKV